jgi:exodeoxyribonuclease-3
MRIITFNVNGIRAMAQKNKAGQREVARGGAERCGLRELIDVERPNVLCLQEIKTQSEADIVECVGDEMPYVFMNACQRKKGYSGVALLSREAPEWVSCGFELFHENWIGLYEGWDVDQEGRLLCAKFSEVIVVTVYVPNAQPELARMGERGRWDALLRKYMGALRATFRIPVMVCGDMNIAPTDADIHRKQPRGTPGASEEERAGFQGFMDDGWADAYRVLRPLEAGYTYWSNFHQARARGRGWRIDLFLVSPCLRERLLAAEVLSSYGGSDHAPVLLEWGH